MSAAKFWLMGAAMYVAQYVIWSDGGGSGRLYWFSGFALLTCAAVGIAVRTLDSRMPWGLLAAGIGTFVAGDVVYYVLEQRADGFPAFPSIADAFYLGGYAFLIVGIVAFGMHSSSSRRVRRAVFVGAGAAIVALSLFWTRFAGDVFNWDGDLVPRVIGLAYPVMTALLVGAIGFLLVAAPQLRISHALVAAGASIFAVGDYAYNMALYNGTFSQGGFTDACWLIAYALFAAAALTEMTLKVAPEVSPNGPKQPEHDTDPSLQPSFLPA